MADVSVVPVAGDPWGAGAVPIAALGATPDADPAPYSGETGSGALDRGVYGLVSGAVDGVRDAVTYPRDVMQGRVDPQSDQGIARTLGMASLMGAGLPVAEEGAVGAMGGKLATKAAAAPADDPFAAIMAALDAQGPAAAVPKTMAETGIADPSAASWSLYHGTGDTWDTFDPSKAGARTSGAERGAMFMSPREGEAANYAHASGGDGARVMPLTVTPGNTGVYDAGQLLASRDPRFMAASRAEFTGSPAGYDAALQRSDADVAYHQDLRSRMPADMAAEMPDYPVVSNLLSPQSAVISMARADGRDTAILRGLGESSGGDQIVALRPGFVYDAATGRQVYAGGIPGSAPALSSTLGPVPPSRSLFDDMLASGRAT